MDRVQQQHGLKVLSIVITAVVLSFAADLRSQTNTNSGNSTDNNSVELSPYAVIERGPHHRIWQQIMVSTNENGGIDYRTNSFTELATGLHHLVFGQFVESDDQIQITANGGIASNSPCIRVAFSAQYQYLYGGN